MLESIVNLQRMTPVDNAGDVPGILANLRARTLGIDRQRRDETLIDPQTAVAELSDDLDVLKPVTGRRGCYRLGLRRYDRVSASTQEQFRDA
ncbi:MAG: hypothetical protein ABI114_15755 [Rhodanobacter sp.]